jgi:cyclic patellamide precursor peptide PatG
MEQFQPEVEQAVTTLAIPNDTLIAVPPFGESTPPVVTPQACATCGNTPVSAAAGPGPRAETQGSPSWIYAIGQIEWRFPTMSIEKEVAQAIGREDTKNLTDGQAIGAALSKPENKYLVRKLCWVMTIQGLSTYILTPRYESGFDQLVETFSSNHKSANLAVVIGAKGPLAPPQMCNGLVVPLLVFDQLYVFPKEEFIAALQKSAKHEKNIEATAHELFDRIMLMTDNQGAMNYNRGPNYLAVRYTRMYEAVAEAFARNESLSNVGVRPSPLSGTQQVVDVIFSFTHRQTGVVSKYFVRVDCTDEFPFVVTPFSPFYET